MDIGIDAPKSLGVKELQTLIDHMLACFNGRSRNAIQGALAWLQELSGCEGVIVCQLHATPALDLRQVINSSYDVDWVNMYLERNFHLVDPVLRLAIRTRGIYEWSRAYKETTIYGCEHFMEAAQDFGLFDGLAYSFTNPARDEEGTEILTVCSLATKPCKIRREAFYTLQSLMPALHVAASGCDLPPPNPLSDRELEVLQWAACGKTAWEIGRLLSVSEATAKFHLANVYRKFNVSNRAQAISLALKTGWL